MVATTAGSLVGAGAQVLRRERLAAALGRQRDEEHGRESQRRADEEAKRDRGGGLGLNLGGGDGGAGGGGAGGGGGGGFGRARPEERNVLVLDWLAHDSRKGTAAGPGGGAGGGDDARDAAAARARDEAFAEARRRAREGLGDGSEAPVAKERKKKNVEVENYRRLR